MNQYDLTSEAIHCRAFIDAESQMELLTAISEWWEVKDKEADTIIEAILFWLDDMYNCHVFWTSLPPGMDLVSAIEQRLELEHKNPFVLPEVDRH